MPVNTTNAEALGHYIADAPHRDLPDDIADAARLCLADWLAVAIGARDEAAGRVVRETASAWGAGGGANGSATVLFGARAAPAFAALANGTLAHCLDFDDTYIPAITHTSAPVWAAVLATGEARGADPISMLKAFATGFEVAARLGHGLGQGLTSRGLHSTGVFGRIGAAAACAVLLGLDAEKAAHALATAATQTSGLVASFGTMAKPFHAGKAAMDGVLSAELAAGGFVAAPGVLETGGGLDRALIQDGSLSLPKVMLDGRAILDNSFKPYAACHLVHPAVDAARQAGVPVAAIRKVKARVSQLAMQVTGAADGNPVSPLAAKFDLRYCIALGLNGGTASARDFLEPWQPPQDVVATAARIETSADPEMTFTSAALDLELADRAPMTIKIVIAKGHPGNPMRWEDMAAKFEGLVEPIARGNAAPIFDAAKLFGVDGRSASALTGRLQEIRAQ